jgi:signal recognition particle subunit SRP54
MLQVKKMGSLSSVIGMLPGMGQMKEALNQVKDSDLDRIAAIIRSMTPQERRTPKILNGSRRLRIAKGSGVTVTEVNNLVDKFYDAQKMMKSMGGMAGMAGMAGLPGMPGAGRKAKRQATGKKGKKGPGRAGGGPKALPAGTPQALPPDRPAGMPQLPPGFSLPKGLPQVPGGNGPDPFGLRRPR